MVAAGKAERRTVALGMRAPDAVQVTKGLAAGDVVVLDPPSALGSGAPVEVQERAAEPMFLSNLSISSRSSPP